MKCDSGNLEALILRHIYRVQFRSIEPALYLHPVRRNIAWGFMLAAFWLVIYPLGCQNSVQSPLHRDIFLLSSQLHLAGSLAQTETQAFCALPQGDSVRQLF